MYVYSVRGEPEKVQASFVNKKCGASFVMIISHPYIVGQNL
jgi:hypothetical protein